MKQLENKKTIRYSNKVIYKNSILSMVYKIISAGLSFVSAPILLYCLGEEKYGAWVSMLSLISWVYYCDLGIGNGLRNKLASSLAVDDFKSSRKYLGISYVIISGISAIVFVVALIAIKVFNITAFLGLDFVDENIDFCLIIAVLFACINFIMALANNMLYALQKASYANLFSVIAQALFIILLIIYAITGIDLILFMAIGEGLSQLIKNIIESLYVFRKNLN